MRKFILAFVLLSILSVGCLAEIIGGGGGAGVTSENIWNNLPDQVLTENYSRPCTIDEAYIGDLEVSTLDVDTLDVENVTVNRATVNTLFADDIEANTASINTCSITIASINTGTIEIASINTGTVNSLVVSYITANTRAYIENLTVNGTVSADRGHVDNLSVDGTAVIDLLQMGGTLQLVGNWIKYNDSAPGGININTEGKVVIGSGAYTASLNVGGDVYISDSVSIDGRVTITGNTQMKTFGGYASITINVTSSNVCITADRSLVYLSATQDIIISCTPSITAGSFDGQLLWLENVNTVNTITLQDNSVLTGSAVNIGNFDGILGPETIVALIWNNDKQHWSIYAESKAIGGVAANANLMPVRNVSGASIIAGKFVKINGHNVGQNLDTIVLADSSNGNHPANGVVIATIANNSNGNILLLGQLSNVIDTSGTSAGDSVYLSTGGDVIFTRPTTDPIQKLGLVTRAHASKGVVVIQGAGRENDTPHNISANGTISANNAVIHGTITASLLDIANTSNIAVSTANYAVTANRANALSNNNISQFTNDSGYVTTTDASGISTTNADLRYILQDHTGSVSVNGRFYIPDVVSADFVEVGRITANDIVASDNLEVWGTASINILTAITANITNLNAGSVTVSNTVNATAFVGDGSELTGLTNYLTTANAYTLFDVIDSVTDNVGVIVQAWDDDLDDIAALSHVSDNIIISDGTDWTSEAIDGEAIKQKMGLVIGTDVLAPDGDGSGLTGISAGPKTVTKSWSSNYNGLVCATALEDMEASVNNRILWNDRGTETIVSFSATLLVSDRTSGPSTNIWLWKDNMGNGVYESVATISLTEELEYFNIVSTPCYTITHFGDRFKIGNNAGSDNGDEDGVCISITTTSNAH